MLINKAFRLRAYPSAEQVATHINPWSDSLRFLWNLALEQRLIAHDGKAKCERRYPTAFDQINELTALRAELPWLAAVPRNVCTQLLVELARAWQRCFAKVADAPHWKRKGKDVVNLCEPHPSIWRLDIDERDPTCGALHFPKLGPMRVVVHRPLEGTRKTCTLVRDGDQWFASIVCEIEIPDPDPRVEPVIAIDRGIVHFGATSDGDFIDNPQHLKSALKRLARAQRSVSRKKKGSRNQIKAKLRVARMHRKVRRQRAHHLHVQSARLAKSHGIVVVEKLNVAGMMKGSCSRSIGDAGWSIFNNMLRYKLTWSGGSLVEVPAAFSSQTCSACGHVDAHSRRSQSLFVCIRCGHRGNADINAAKILKGRANRSAMPVEEPPLEGARRNRKVGAVKLRMMRGISTSAKLRPLGRG